MQITLVKTRLPVTLYVVMIGKYLAQIHVNRRKPRDQQVHHIHQHLS
jgi:hypothetical protein